MKSNEYVKLVGWEYAKLNASSCSHQYYFLHNGYAEVCVSELKRLAESHELVSNFGGLKRAKRILKKAYTSFNTMISVVWNDKPFQCNIQKLENAIADVESCQ